MSEKAKVPVIILIILIIAALSLAGGAFFLFQQEHAKNQALQEELEELKTRQKITESKLEESKHMLTAMDAKLKATSQQVEILTGELTSEKNAKEEALTQINQLKVELEQQKSLRTDLETKLGQAQKDVRDAQVQLNGLESKKNELESKIAELQVKSSELENKMQGVELGKIVVGPGKAKAKDKRAIAKASKETKAAPLALAKGENIPAAGGLEGKILVVNKDYNFIVINVGSKDGVAINDTFSVFHNDKYIGDVKVNKVHDSMAAADFVTSGLQDMISENDKVVRNS